MIFIDLLFCSFIISRADITHMPFCAENFDRIPGGHSYGVTPVPIPNTVVKSVAPMVLVWRRTGRVGTARCILESLEIKLGGFFCD